MNDRVELDERWPEHGASEDSIRQVLAEKLNTNLTWGESIVLGFPSMSPCKFGLEAYETFLNRHTNAILTHTRTAGEKGFDGIKDLEREVVYMVANLLGSENPREEIDGYIPSGGSESNIEALWIGREFLRADGFDPKNPEIAVLTSPAAHYSIRKACSITDLGEGTWDKKWFFNPKHDPSDRNSPWRIELPVRFHSSNDGSGLHLVRCNSYGQIDVNALEDEIIRLKNEKGIQRFIVVLNEGAIMTGAMDQTNDVCQMLSLVEIRNPDVRFFVHVDAAFGGFIYPFTDPNGIWGLKVPGVHSIGVDPYKMGLAPIAQSIFLCRKDLQSYIQRNAGYVDGKIDDTVSGSRAGANAAACFAIFKKMGRNGFAQMWEKALALADSLHSQLGEIAWIEPLPRMLNMVSFLIPQNASDKILAEVQRRIIRPYIVMWDLFSTDPTNPDSQPRMIVRCIITRDTKQEWIDSFVGELKAIF